ncbi:MAG: diphthine--ammonia ligase [Pyrodictiaceae archaeon]
MSPLKACVMYTGGKDSCYSLHWAVYHGLEVECLLTVKASSWDSRLFHYPGHELVRLHGEALGLPVEVVEAPMPREEEELRTLRRLFAIARREYGAEIILSGALLSDYQRLLFSIAAWREGLHVLTPLWRKSQEEYMRSLVREGFKILILSVQAYGLPPTYVGRVLDEKLVEDIIRRARIYGFNPAFEGGEAETLVLDAPLFRRRLVIEGSVVRLGPEHYMLRVEAARLVDKA